MNGFGTAARGYPDVGLVTRSEMVQDASHIASAVDGLLTRSRYLLGPQLLKRLSTLPGEEG